MNRTKHTQLLPSGMWPDDPNWQMTGLFLLAVALTGVAMKLVVQFQPSQATEKRSRVFWLLLSPTSHRRLQSIKIRAVLLRTLGSIGLLILCYQVYWPLLVQNLGIRGVILSYAAAPVLLVVSETPLYC
ncbi:MAG: hypothetical protein ACPGVU_24550 [Limisphaerales bacterium]